MKKYLFVLLAFLSLVSCSKDETGEDGFSVVGKWVQTYYRNSGTNSFIGQEDGSYFLFGSDGSFTFFYSGWGAINETTTGKYRQEGSNTLRLQYGEGETATVVISNLQEDGEATFTIDGLLYTGVYKFKRR